MEELKNYEIWLEGSCDNSCEGIAVKAQMLGKCVGTSFHEACIKFMKEYDGKPAYKGGPNAYYYNKDINTYWGCRLYDNETDARKTFG